MSKTDGLASGGPAAAPADTDETLLADFAELRRHIEQQILGQSELVERLLIALLADGHLLVEGAPGLAKTRAVKALASGIDGDFQRVQFTPAPGRPDRHRDLPSAGGHLPL